MIILDGAKLFSLWFYTKLLRDYVVRIFIKQNKGKIRLSLVTSMLEDTVLGLRKKYGKVFVWDNEVYFDK